MVSEPGKPGFKGFHLLHPLSLPPVPIFRVTSQRRRRSQLDVLWGSGWLWSVREHSQGGDGKQEHSCNDGKILLCVGKSRDFK